jgi:hypothetical protein
MPEQRAPGPFCSQLLCLIKVLNTSPQSPNATTASTQARCCQWCGSTCDTLCAAGQHLVTRCRVCCAQLLVEGLRQMCLRERAAASGEARSYSALTQAPSEWEEVVRILQTLSDSSVPL